MKKKSSTKNPSKKRTKTSRSESHLQKTQKIAQIASWELDLKSGDLSWSDEVFNIFEIPRGTSLSYEGFLQAVLPEDREYVEQQWQAALDGEPYDIEHRIRAGKEIKWLREKADLEFDKKGCAVRGVGIVQDITAQKTAEQELRRAKIDYRMIADYTYDWEWWENLDGTFRYVSPSCERITGYKADRFIENHSLLREIIVPEDRGKWDKHYNASHKDIGRREMQFRIKRPDGEVRWIEHACQPVFTRENEYLGIRASNRDITERKQAEMELKKSLTEINRLKDLHEKESLYLREEINLEHNYKNIIGNSNAIQYVLFKVEQVAETDSSVLILGETGTGKELIARAIHHNSQRKDRPLIKINCATLPANLIESELFGHEKGSFTGAQAKHAGRFEVADGSSIFLDEIGELPIELQAKLLRVIEDGEFERLGSSKTMKVDVRIIAATNRDLEQDIQAERFRRDLWYRLNVFPITVPPLRERLEDIPLIVQYYVDILARKLGKDIASVPVKIVKALQSYTWPGNVRELENVLERAVINTSGSKLRLSEELKPDHQASPESFKSLHDLERDYIVKVLEKTNWKVSGKNSAAEILGLDRSTLRARMKKLGIRKP
jgi:chemotaxis protein methyltransferase CheR